MTSAATTTHSSALPAPPVGSTPDVLAELRQRLRDRYARLPLADRPVALVDLPNYLNIGDSLIALGEFQLLRETHPAMRAIHFGREAPEHILQRLNNERGVLLIHGGGNFGSLWPKHQQLREHAARVCPNATIIQLPQSVHFDDPQDMRRSLGVLAAHGDFHVFIRDHASHQLLADAGLATLELLPDSAFAIAPAPASPARADVLVLRREDGESRHGQTLLEAAEALRPARVEVGDWADESSLPADPSVPEKARVWAARKLLRRLPKPSVQRVAWTALSRARLDLGRRILSVGRVVLTDRLHVHVLCVLTGKPHVFLDNSYGKIRGLAEACGTLGPQAVEATDTASAVEAVRTLLDRTA